MRLMDIETRLVAWYNSSVQPGGGSIRLRSHPGLGKTSVVSTVAPKLASINPGKKYGFVLVNGAVVTLTSATGYLVLTEADENGRRRSEFSLPNWWFTSEGIPLDAYDGGVIMVDEDDKLGLDEKKIMGEGALSKVLGNHRCRPVGSFGSRAISRDALRLAVYKLAAQVSSKDMGAVLSYVKRIPQEEFQIIFGRAAVTRESKLLVVPQFMEWAKNKASLIALMSQLK